LQPEQAVTTFHQVVWPPRERGSTWSNVSSCAWKRSPQYWQENLSRRKTLKRVKAGLRLASTYSFNAITLGSRISKEGLRTTVSYSCTIETRSRNTALTASCQHHSESGK
jgi:hypothetical protein